MALNTKSFENRKIVVKISACDFISAVMCFVFSRASLLTYMNPFGLAAFGAMFSPGGWYYSLATAICGIVLAKGDITAMRYILSLGIATPVIGLFEKRGIVFRAFAVSLSYVFVCAFLLIAEGFTPYDMIFCTFEGFISFVAVLVMGNASQTVISLKKRQRLNVRESVSVLACVCLFILAASEIPEIFGTNLYSMVAVFILLCVALFKGTVATSCAGVIIGTVVSFAGGESAAVIGVYSLCAFTAGLFRRYSRPGVLLGFTLANGIAAAFLYDSAFSVINPVEVAIAGIVFATLPRKTVSGITGVMKKLDWSDAGDKSDELQRLYVIANELNELAAVYRDSVVVKKPGKFYIGTLYNVCVERVCSNCRNKYNCWQSGNYRNYEYMNQMMTYCGVKGKLDSDGLPKSFEKCCINKQRFVDVFNGVYDIYKTDSMWFEKMYRVRLAMADQLSCISESIHKKSHPKKARYSFINYGRQVAKHGEKICGDSICELNLPNGDCAVILSDGMGSGSNAHTQSNDTVRLLKSMLMCGFDIAEATQIVNSSLIIRSNKESFSTVDVLYMDCESGQVTLVKAGSAPAYEMYGQNIKKYECNNLPVGILKDIQLRIYNTEALNNSVFVMVSDGVYNTLAGTDEKQDSIARCMSGRLVWEADELCDCIMEEAISASGGKPDDDMTVHTVAVRLV